ncbi:MAG: poly-beta-1,6 N-acetyl-D-glucosamine export porin PgaA [Acidobacteriaceae bacterium]
MAIFVFILPSTGPLCANGPSAPRIEREAAVTQARDGDAKGGLMVLQGLLLRFPDDPRLLADTTIVAGWAGEDALVLKLYDRAQTPKQDTGVVEAAAHAARDLHQYQRALGLYRLAEHLSPERWQPRLGEAMVLTDMGFYQAASAKMRPLVRGHGQEKDVQLGGAYLCSRQGDLACVMAEDERHLEQAPQDAASQRQLAQALSQVGGETQAMQVNGFPSPISPISPISPLSPLVQRALEAAAGAEDIRWGEAYAPTRKQQEAESERALARLDHVIATSATKDAIWQQAQDDRLLALVDLQRMHEAVRSYLQLRQQGFPVPMYALQRVAEAYLALRQPEGAAALYREVLQHLPNDGGAWSGLAYAQLESGDIRGAFQSIDRAYAEAPVWLQAPGLKVPKGNRMHTQLGLQAAQMRGDVGMPAEEQRRLAPLLGAAPANVDLGRAMAMTYLARGWPLRAMQQERIADSNAQEDEVPSLDSAEIDETAGRRDEVDTMLPSLMERKGDAPDLQHFLRDRAIGRGWLFDADGASEWSSGQFIGSTDQHSEAHLYTPLIGNRWRIYAHELRDNGNFIEGYAVRLRAGLGATYNYDRQMYWGEIAGDTGSYGTRAAINTGARWSFGDHWALRAEADSDSIADVMLVAVLANVHARSLDMRLGWYSSELRSANVGLQRVLFSDGNQRAALSGGWEERVWTSPRLQVTVNPQLWASSNSLNEDRLYFNPKHDFSLGPSTTLDWMTWRRYDHSFHQEATIYAAPYWQQNYGTGTAFVASYAQHWKINERVGAFWGATWDSQPYDGSNEPYTALNFGMTWGPQ